MYGYRHVLAASLAVGFWPVVTPNAPAQQVVLNLPKISQHARITQEIGITNITIDYHRPQVKGRKVLGGLQPYGKVWSVGANENTTIEFSDAVTVEGKPLAAGLYGVLMIPGENDWVVIFSKITTAWGGFFYDEKEDALRVTVKPQVSEFHEALTFDFDDPKPNATTVTFHWDKVAVPFKVEVNTDEIVSTSLHRQLLGLAQFTWEGWNDAANYLLTHKTNLDDALKYADRSIQVEQRFENLITKADLLDALNRKDEATVARNQALNMASAPQLHTYGLQLQSRGKQEQAFEVFRMNIKKNPNHWLAHNEAARMACAKGDFDTAVKEMKQSAAAATESNKPAMEALVTRLENKEDINK